MTSRTITAKPIQKFSLQQAAERPDLAILEIQVVGETAHYTMPLANVRKLAEALLNEVAKLEGSAKPN